MVFLIVPFKNKMATDGGGGVGDNGGGGVGDNRHGDDCKRDIGHRLKSQPGNNFFC